MFKKITLVLLVGLVLLGCEMMLDGPTPQYQPVKPKPLSPTQRPKPNKALKINRGICTASCAEMIEAAKMSTERKREKMLKEYAVMTNLSAHEQIHLVDICLACLDKPPAAEVMMTLARNSTLTKRAHRHLKIKSDKLYSKDEKRLRKLLKQNTGSNNNVHPGKRKGVI